MSAPEASLVISTLGREHVLERLFESLEHQTQKNFEVIVVDQNADDRLMEVLDQARWNFPVTHVHRPDVRGLSRGRNIGWRLAKSQFVLFPDDDCWYPPWFLQYGLDSLRQKHLAILCGRCTDITGRSINARFSSRSHIIDKRNVWTGQMEAFSFFSRETLMSTGGFDEQLGVGAASPWQAAEGPDLIIRSIKLGFKCYFDPALHGYHEEYDISEPGRRMIHKARAYARGMGFVLRKHNYGLSCVTYWVMRSLFNTIRHLLMGKTMSALFYYSVACGRLEGWLGLTANAYHWDQDF